MEPGCAQHQRRRRRRDRLPRVHARALEPADRRRGRRGRAELAAGRRDGRGLERLVRAGLPGPDRHRDGRRDPHGRLRRREHPRAGARLPPERGACGAKCAGGGFTYDDFGKIVGGPEVHADGEIWAQTLWDLRRARSARRRGAAPRHAGHAAHAARAVVPGRAQRDPAGPGRAAAARSGTCSPRAGWATTPRPRVARTSRRCPTPRRRSCPTTARSAASSRTPRPASASPGRRSRSAGRSTSSARRRRTATTRWSSRGARTPRSSSRRLATTASSSRWRGGTPGQPGRRTAAQLGVVRHRRAGGRWGRPQEPGLRVAGDDRRAPRLDLVGRLGGRAGDDGRDPARSRERARLRRRPDRGVHGRPRGSCGDREDRDFAHRRGGLVDGGRHANVRRGRPASHEPRPGAGGRGQVRQGDDRGHAGLQRVLRPQRVRRLQLRARGRSDPDADAHADGDARPARAGPDSRPDRRSHGRADGAAVRRPRPSRRRRARRSRSPPPASARSRCAHAAPSRAPCAPS